MLIDDAWASLHRAADIAAARGSLIFHLDLATELARAAFALRGAGVDGMATLAGPDGYRVIGFDAGPRRRAVAEARFDRDGSVEVVPAGPLSPRAVVLADARATVAAAAFAGARHHAAIVVPAGDPRAPIEAYALAVGDDPETAMCGGHWLVTLDATGQRITGREAVTVGAADGAVPVRTLRDTVLTVAGATPNEIHTYLSLKHGIPLRVDTKASGVCWRIDGERTDVQRRAAA